MLCILKYSFVDRETMDVVPKGTIMETVSISDQNICLTDIRNTNKKLSLAPEEFMDEEFIEILDGGV